MASRARNRRRFKSSTSRLTMQSYAMKGCVLTAPSVDHRVPFTARSRTRGVPPRPFRGDLIVVAELITRQGLRLRPTVKTYVARLLSKLDLRDRAQAVVVAYETGVVEVGESP